MVGLRYNRTNNNYLSGYFFGAGEAKPARGRSQLFKRIDTHDTLKHTLWCLE